MIEEALGYFVAVALVDGPGEPGDTKSFKNQMAHFIDKRIRDKCIVSSNKPKFDDGIFDYLHVL